MEFNLENTVVQLCAKGMELEGLGKLNEASLLFYDAWEKAENDFEKFIAAHYVARRQSSISDKLKWDETALKHALNLDNETVKASLPSLYLNIGKCYEDLNAFEIALKHYEEALSFTKFLPLNGYGNMVKNGIYSGLERVKKHV